jgi:hypothetical protein
MKNSTLLVIAALILGLPSLSIAQEAQVVPELKGIKLGITLEQFHDLVYGPEDYNDVLKVTGKRPTSPTDADSYWGADRGEKGWSMFVASRGRIPPTIGGEEADIQCLFKKATDSKKNSTLYTILAQFPASVADAVLEGLKNKYGPPAKLDEVSKSNRMGVQIKGYRALWYFQNNRFVISLESVGVEMEKASLTVRPT